MSKTIHDLDGNNKNNRIQFIEGLRGLLAFLVVINHVVCAFYPWLFYNDKANTEFQKIWINSPLNAISNGNFAVQLFYILSGYLITKKYIKDSSLLFNPIKHYIKMAKITVPSILMICLAMKMGLVLNVKTSQLNEQFNVLFNLNNFFPSWKEAMHEAFYKVFTIDYCKYNPPLWFVMPYFYSVFVIHILNGYFCRIKNFKYITIISVICIILVSGINYHMCGPIYGLLIAYSEVRRRDRRFTKYPIVRILYYFAIIYFSSINIEATGIWEILGITKDTKAITMIRQLGCAILFSEIIRSEKTKKILSLKLWRAVGYDSMFIFAYHWLYIITAGCAIYIFSYNRGIHSVVTGLAILLSTIVSTSFVHRVIVFIFHKITICRRLQEKIIYIYDKTIFR